MTNPAPAAAASRRSISSQGLRLSDSDMAQKSCPSGAPTRAATASIAVTPGTIATSSVRHAAVAALDLLAHRRRHRKHAGIAAGDQRDMRALSRRGAAPPRARAPSSRLSEAWRICPARAGTRSR